MRGRYIVGLLAPKGQSIIPDDEEPLAVDGSSDGQDGKADTAVGGAGLVCSCQTW